VIISLALVLLVTASGVLISYSYDDDANFGVARRVFGQQDLGPDGGGIVPRARSTRERPPVGQGGRYVTESADDHDVFATEADNGRELAHAIVYGSRVAYRFGVEDVCVERWDRVCHVASDAG